MSVASLQVTKTYADGSAYTEAIIDTAYQSIQTYTQTSLVNNFNQLRKDIWGATYSLDNDGNANNTNTMYKEMWGKSYTGNSPRTNSLYEKQSASIFSTTTTNLNLSATGTWTEASQAYRLVFSPEATGKYLLTYHFTVRQETRGTGDIRAAYALFNKTANATLAAFIIAQELTGTLTHDMQKPVTLTYIHKFTSTAAATFTVYFKNLALTATVQTHSISCSSANKVGVYGQIHKI